MGKKRETEPDVDNEEYGKPFKYDPTFNGPLHKRSCTDIICLLIFVVFIAAWVAVGIVAFSNGNPARLISPIDYEGNHCGVDEVVADKPYLFYFDITKCVRPTSISKPLSCNTPQVCVAKCPDKVFIAELEIKNHGISEFADDLICKYSVDKDKLTSITHLKQECAPWYIPSTKVAGHCIPSLIKFSEINDTEVYKYLSDIKVTLDDLKNNSKVIHLLSKAKEVGETIVRDLSNSWPYIIGGLALAMFLSLIYIVLMRWFAGVMIWVSLFGVLGLLAYCVYASYVKYSEMSDEEETQDYDDSIEGRFKSLLALKSTWLVFLIASAIMLVIILIIILFLRKRIRIAVALIGEASRAVSSATSTLAFPLVPWFLQLAVIAWAVSVGLCLLASAKPTFQVTHFSNNSECPCNYTEGSSCTPQQFHTQCRYENGTACEEVYCLKVGRELDTYLDYMHVLNIFGFFWGLFFMSAFGEMVLAGTFATWYWTFKKSDVPFFTLTHSLLRTLRYHLGTLAFGSLILAICRMIRVMLEYLNKKLGKYDNAFVRAVMCCLRCFFWCLEKFIRFINRNAYIMCAIHGKNFCKSARDAFNLLMRNIIRVFVLDKVTDFLLFLGKFMITAGMVALSFYFFGDKLQFEEVPEIHNAVPDLNYYFVPVIVIGIGTYFITSVFFGVYAMAVDTLFLCFLEDCERNDGSPEKPYFMSKHLMKILGKKNKKYKEH
ncbi:choline transporter-like 2 [Anabrus simplex]|uniref:choline transporter-like 2 n=1 Tax=Anabrus simplex TaxID=316456 RepID=UPI0035A2A094